LDRAITQRVEWVDAQIEALEALKANLLAFRRDADAEDCRTRKEDEPCKCADSGSGEGR
jgi:hypothetical protein